MVQERERTNLGIEPATLLDIYRQMSRIHEVDKAIRSGISAGRFQFTYWPMTGQEAIPATLATLTDTDDYMVTIYRGIHDQVAKGVPLKGLFAEAMARQDGLNKGKGGSPHISDPTSGSMLTTAIVGAGAPIANGLALAAKMRGEGRVTVVNFGDGATSIGAVHEAMNLAGAWKLPIIFMCQNNQIGEYTRIPEYTASPDFAGRAAGYGFRGEKVNANDPIAFHRVMKDVVEHVRAGNGPVFVEAVTLRLGTHAGFAPNELLTKDQLEAGRADWPVPKTRALLLETGISTEEQLAGIDAAAAAEVAEAIEFASASSPIGTDDMLNDVYADPVDVPRRGVFPIREAEVAVSGETRKMAMYEAVISAQDYALGADKGVFLLGEDIGDPPGGVFKTTAGLQTKWGKERVRPTPIAEQAIIGAATGAALVGMRPVAEIMFADFMGVCLDQITNHAAKQRYMSGGATNVPMTMRILCAGGLGGFGAQHSQSLEAWLLHVPGLKVVYPSTTLDARGLLTSCIFDDDPCVHLESMALLFGASKEEVPLGDYRVPFGVAKVRREGTDISLITFGWQVYQCLAAADELAKEGVSAEVIDLRSLMPLDYHRVLDSVKKTRRALVVHAATEFCGLGSEIASTINEELFPILKGPACRFGADYSPISFSKEIEAKQMPHTASIVARVKEVMRDR
jgi:pyruvate/2-oxoglutarate/acetoin dehydrogenase E1 component/TPP-dependent pyruvate/acetoin dehydrogenase alpha subunit